MWSEKQQRLDKQSLRPHPSLLKVTQVPGQISEPVGGATGLLAVVATSALRDPGSPHTHQEAMNEEDHG